MEKIEIKEDVEIKIKRFYLPIQINTICPSCSNELIIDFDDDHHLSFPTLNNWEKTYVCCGNCGDKFNFPTKLKISMEYDLDKIEKL